MERTNITSASSLSPIAITNITNINCNEKSIRELIEEKKFEEIFSKYFLFLYFYASGRVHISRFSNP